jgi:gliding motility-associated-like protein
VVVYPLPIVTAKDITVCEGDLIRLRGDGASTYQWSDGKVNDSPFIAYQSASYEVIGTDLNGCSNATSIFVTVHPKPEAKFEPYWQKLVAHFENQSEDATAFIWDYGDGSPKDTAYNGTHIYLDMDSLTRAITLISKSKHGCLDTFTAIIRLPLFFYVPNTFTPDGSKNNNTFHPVYSDLTKITQFTFRIFNRWGQLIWESIDPTDQWDGSFNQTPCQDGTYTWYIEFSTLSDSKPTKVHGHVNLIR